MNSVINLVDKLSAFETLRSPNIVGHYNGNELMVLKVKGEFVWHSHPDTGDEKTAAKKVAI